MAISRLGPQRLAEVVGATAVTRLKNKLRGGDSAQKGFRYETLFGAHRIARLLRKLIDSGEDALVEWQSDGFIDDFVVRRDSRQSVKAYQMKNSPSAAWESEIQEDFANQYAVSSEEGYTDIRLRLVCSDRVRTELLATNVPNVIAQYSRAIHFPWDKSVLSVVTNNRWVADDFGYLSRHVSPNISEIADVVSVVMGAWDTLAPSSLVSEVLYKARRTSPMMIRTLQSDAEAMAQLLPQFVTTIGALPDFKYDIQRGFFHWTAFGGSTKGTFSQDCFSEQFRGLQEHIIALKPASVDQIESLLQ